MSHQVQRLRSSSQAVGAENSKEDISHNPATYSMDGSILAKTSSIQKAMNK